jgi:hypothetical protein
LSAALSNLLLVCQLEREATVAERATVERNEIAAPQTAENRLFKILSFCRCEFFHSAVAERSRLNVPLLLNCGKLLTFMDKCLRFDT